MFAVRDVFV